MNEQRLDELWEQTREHCIAWRLSPEMDRKIPSVREEEQFMYKMFAELIIWECIYLLETSLPYNPQQKMIKKHFGIEE